MIWIRAAIALLSLAVIPAKSIPDGTVIPIMVGTSLNSDEDAPGKAIDGRVMQDVPVPGGKIDKQSRVTGHVVSVFKQGASGPGMVVKFDTLQDEGHVVPMTTGLLAVASMLSVASAQSPISTNSDVDPMSQWVTRQIGGDIVRRGAGKAFSREGVTGRWLAETAVIIKLTANPQAGCPGGDGYDREQAVWIFSSDACGAYGLKNTKVENSGAQLPLGEIRLTSKENVKIAGGSGWLLIVVGAPKQ